MGSLRLGETLKQEVEDEVGEVVGVDSRRKERLRIAQSETAS